MGNNRETPGVGLVLSFGPNVYEAILLLPQMGPRDLSFGPNVYEANLWIWCYPLLPEVPGVGFGIAVRPKRLRGNITPSPKDLRGLSFGPNVYEATLWIRYFILLPNLFSDPAHQTAHAHSVEPIKLARVTSYRISHGSYRMFYLLDADIPFYNKPTVSLSRFLS